MRVDVGLVVGVGVGVGSGVDVGLSVGAGVDVGLGDDVGDGEEVGVAVMVDVDGLGPGLDTVQDTLVCDPVQEEAWVTDSATATVAPLTRATVTAVARASLGGGRRYRGVR